MKTFAISVALCIFLVQLGHHPALPAGRICQAKNDDEDNCRDSSGRKEKPRVFFINNTGYDLEDIAMWTCDYLDIKNVTICVAFQFKDYEHEGWVGRDKDIYHIYLKRDIANVNLIFVHELIHVKQYESNELVVKDPSTVLYHGDLINLKRMDYQIRPYEVEAHLKDARILREYNKYKKSMAKNLEE